MGGGICKSNPTGRDNGLKIRLVRVQILPFAPKLTNLLKSIDKLKNVCYIIGVADTYFCFWHISHLLKKRKTAFPPSLAPFFSILVLDNAKRPCYTYVTSVVHICLALLIILLCGLCATIRRRRPLLQWGVFVTHFFYNIFLYFLTLLGQSAMV